MWQLFLDESGDLGFDFQDKHPSRFLTISILATSQRETVTAIRNAVRNTLRRKVNRRKKCENELKGSKTSINVKRFFYSKIADRKFAIYSMTLNKIRVNEELRRNAITKERLYNYIAKQILDCIPFEKADSDVQLIVDKSKGRWEIGDFNKYVFSQLSARLDPRAKLQIYHRESFHDHCLSAADLFAWGIFRRYERKDEEWYDVFREKILLDKQYL